MDERPESLNGEPIPYDLPIEELRRQLQAAGPHAWATVEALGYHTSPDAFTILLQLLNSSDWRYRRSALEAIVHHPLVNTRQEKICQLLNDPSVYVIRTACEVVGKIKAEHGLPQLKNLLSSTDPETRIAVIRAFPYLWEPGLFDRVLEVFLTDPSDLVKKAAAWVLMGAADETNWERLFDIWKKDQLARHRKWACQLAKRYGNEM
jgi:HEAT repeat protein